MPKERRAQTQILYEILLACKEKSPTKTALVYRTNFNFTRIEKYVKLLLARRLIEEVQREGEHIYVITETGKKALQTLDEALQLILGTPLGLEIRN